MTSEGHRSGHINSQTIHLAGWQWQVCQQLGEKGNGLVAVVSDIETLSMIHQCL